MNTSIPIYICTYHLHTILYPARSHDSKRIHDCTLWSRWLPRSLLICAPATMTSNTPKGQRWKSLLVASSPHWWLPLLIAGQDCCRPQKKKWYPEATTTAMICGLVDVEFLKLVLGTGWRRDFNAEALNPFGDGSNRLYQFMPCCRMNMRDCFWFHRGRGFWPIAISVH